MARYFFNVFDGKDFFDDVGVELSGVKEARQHMLTLAMSLVEQLTQHGSIWQMEALDDAGKIVGTMEFGLDEREKSGRTSH